MLDAGRTKNCIIQWISAFFSSCPQAKAIVGISGGKDSAVVAALCKEAIGRERVLGILMPQGEQWDIDSAYTLCSILDIPHKEINIQIPVQELYGEIKKTGLELNEVAIFNTPARVRMAVLYAISGITGGRVANTSNLSEDWVGYATKFGDAAGDFAPLANLTASEVKAIGRALGLPAGITEKTPIDGLCGKTDEDNLGFTYADLDRYIREGVCEDAGIRKKIDRLHREHRHKFSPMPAFMP
ncbi:MAG: NAD(+) synthase [Oscillospiraceae bacterium]|nr:NAD(+) synthase [Oscillospiraceae bacterium]